jgi:hypothetical protein
MTRALFYLRSFDFVRSIVTSVLTVEELGLEIVEKRWGGSLGSTLPALARR